MTKKNKTRLAQGPLLPKPPPKITVNRDAKNNAKTRWVKIIFKLLSLNLSQNHADAPGQR
jgi:hypothetical protein